MGVASGYKADLLKGQSALITGGGSGIGLATATALARHGANVALAASRYLSCPVTAAIAINPSASREFSSTGLIPGIGASLGLTS